MRCEFYEPYISDFSPLNHAVFYYGHFYNRADEGDWEFHVFSTADYQVNAFTDLAPEHVEHLFHGDCRSVCSVD